MLKLQMILINSFFDTRQAYRLARTQGGQGSHETDIIVTMQICTSFHVSRHSDVPMSFHVSRHSDVRMYQALPTDKAGMLAQS